MLDAIPAQLEKLIDADRQAGRRQNQRARVGLYTWSQPMAAATRHLNLVSAASAAAHPAAPEEPDQ
jgi:hypothetical protein